jgi:hypothetical protein
MISENQKKYFRSKDKKKKSLKGAAKMRKKALKLEIEDSQSR